VLLFLSEDNNQFCIYYVVVLERKGMVPLNLHQHHFGTLSGETVFSAWMDLATWPDLIQLCSVTCCLVAFAATGPHQLIDF